jgi:hypothetical protein
VPANRRSTVVNNVRRQAPVPPNWDPADEATFREAVEQKYRRTVAASARSVTVSGDVIPPGLSFQAFVARPGLQRELQAGLKLPSTAVVATSYGSEAEFTRLFDQAVAFEAAKRLERFTAKDSDLEPGGRFHADAEDAARGAIVPPVALFFSLLGAIGHFSKLLYLIATLLLLMRSNADGVLSRRSAWIAFGVLVCAGSSVWIGLSLTQNDVTRSELFVRMVDWMEHGPDGAKHESGIGNLALSNIIHVVAVGQGYGYPLNEGIRVNVLQGLSYGYHPVR